MSEVKYFKDEKSGVEGKYIEIDENTISILDPVNDKEIAKIIRKNGKFHIESQQNNRDTLDSINRCLDGCNLTGGGAWCWAICYGTGGGTWG